MVKLREDYHRPEDGLIDPELWIKYLAGKRTPDEINFLRQVFSVMELSRAAETKTITPLNCLQYGLATADILEKLHLDMNTVAAGLLYPILQYSDLHLEDVAEELGKPVTKLLEGVQRMDAMGIIRTQKNAPGENHVQVDNLRKMFLAMVDDVRVVLIKLAERTVLMQHLKQLPTSKQQEIAKETRDIYAPLANRLGMGQMKWMLEDLAFRYLDAETYRQIASLVDQKRVERELYIQKIIKDLNTALNESGIHEFDIQGRAKHIYSIYKKMQRKGGDFHKLYDVIAVRVQVPTIENCYTTLAIVNSLWKPIPEEFDDYINRPKPNGYRSIHTAVIGADDRKFEVQIRTFEMHQESELGVAAHWIYKEGGRVVTSYDQKITWLRQVIDWHKEVAEKKEGHDKPEMQVLEDTVYVFTPTGEIIDLTQGSTPLDFAYAIHTEVGHRCRGAKVNKQIVPLTTALKTGDQVEILTAKHPAPSRDWLSPSAGYLKTSRARAKVHHWFKLQDYEKHIVEGRESFEREIKRLGLTPPDLESLAKRFQYKSADDLFAALGAGDMRLGQITHSLESTPPIPVTEDFIPISKPKPVVGAAKGIHIEGVSNLLTQLANCCKPVPGDPIIGFITQGRGLNIHRQDCPNILHIQEDQKVKLTPVAWGGQGGTFPVDIFVEASDRQGLLRDITSIISGEKINLTALNTITDPQDHHAKMVLTIEINNVEMLQRILDRLQQLPEVIGVERLKGGH